MLITDTVMSLAKNIKFKLLFLLLVCMCVQNVFPQAPKLVVGYVFNKEEFEKNRRKNIPLNPSEVTIFIFNTVSEAKDVYEKFKSGQFSDEYLLTNVVSPDAEGYYEAVVPDNGALVIRYGLGEPALEPINGRSKIVTYLDGGITLEGVSIIGSYTEVTAMPSVPEQFGNIVYINNANVLIPNRVGKSNARMLVSPYLYNKTTDKIVHYRSPRLYNGREFTLTQNRYTGFAPWRDPLYKFTVDEKLSNKKNVYYWNDTVVLPNVTDRFQILADVYIHDYRGVYKTMNLKLSTLNPRKPLKFLEYNMDGWELDPYLYEEKAKKKLVSGTENVSFNFEIGKAELDMSDTVNVREVERLKASLTSLVSNVSSKLKELHVTSVSSPDGPYGLNKSLSLRRLKFAEQLIKNMLPADKVRNVYTYTENPSHVASWSEFAEMLKEEMKKEKRDSLLCDSLSQAIDGIEKVIAKYPKSHDSQSVYISRLPLYKKFIVRYLPRLRNMKCEYLAEEFRELKPEEILRLYQSDDDYRTGKKHLELYEYWNLFNIIEDSAELENIYKIAYDYSASLNSEKKPWVLAANNLAVSYLKRDTFDLSILAPLIDTRVASCNVKRTVGNSVQYVNLEQVVANQLIMYIRSGDFANASIMAKILPDNDRYKEIKAFTYCLGGYYKIDGNISPEEKERRESYIEIVRNSSPMNNVVLLLAMGGRRNLSEAIGLLESMSPTDAKVCYLKAVAYNNMGEGMFNNAMLALKNSFIYDSSLVDVARNDGDIGDDLFESAFELYNVEKDLNK